ncbi:hypothetical protein N566_01700 [Streptomycetaceae bacterium MP113-05]|nr:hypothetical protein N566_01700 [Streptomycetaceae bacterium MP113-05]
MFVHDQRYDGAFWKSHAEEFQSFFPLHDKCNDSYDLVPVWVNPSIVVLTVLVVISLFMICDFSVSKHLRRRKTGA